MKEYIVKYTKSDDLQITIKADSLEEAKQLVDTKLLNMSDEEIEAVSQKGSIEHYETQKC